MVTYLSQPAPPHRKERPPLRRHILKLWLHEPAGTQTTSITVHEEGKTDRGALKVISREKLEDGRFRIVYRADFRDDSFADVVAEWLKKYGARKQD